MAASGAVRIANAPVSFGAFDLAASLSPGVATAERMLAALAAAGYDGTELGPPGYLGDRATLRARLEAHGLELAGGYVPIRFGEGGDELAPLEETLDLFDAAGGSPRPVLADDCERDGPADWPRLAAAVARAAARARERGYEPTFHHHMGTRVQTPEEIERLLDLVDIPLLLDSGHLVAAGGDPLRCLRNRRAQIDHVHVKDVNLGLLRSAPSWPEAWRGGVFCELGTGDVDVAGFLAELADYSGWVVVEQDWVPHPGDDDVAAQIEAQARNRRWLTEYAGL
jgi:inosose dehydratase